MSAAALYNRSSKHGCMAVLGYNVLRPLPILQPEMSHLPWFGSGKPRMKSEQESVSTSQKIFRKVSHVAHAWHKRPSSPTGYNVLFLLHLVEIQYEKSRGRKEEKKEKS